MRASAAELNDRHGRSNVLRIESGRGGLEEIRIENAAASAQISVYGGHVLSYRRRDGQPVLWLSEVSWFERGKPIRGGIPICWPWFGSHPEHPDLPAHGFARICEWSVLETAEVDAETTRVVLGLEDNESTRALWPHAFTLKLAISVGRELTLELTTCNRGDSAFRITEALHTYFAVGNVAAASVLGFDGCPFVDTVGGANTPGVQNGPVRITQETDLVFTDCPGAATLEDPACARKVLIEKSGSKSAVVWNPWVAKSARMPDFGDSEYPGMICVETTNARGDEIIVAPGHSHCLKAVICPLDL